MKRHRSRAYARSNAWATDVARVTTTMSEVETLMKEWFALKDAQRAKKRELVKFHETYECKNMQSNGYMEEPIQCIYRAEFGRHVDDFCEPCGTRHNFYMQRQENARRRTAILNKVRHILLTQSKDSNKTSNQSNGGNAE